MPDKKLKTAVLGMDKRGRIILEAAAKAGYFHIQAIADKDTKLVEKLAEKYNCQPYDDYRQLIIQNQFDCLIVAEPIYSCAEYLRAAMKKKINVLKLSPLARNFEEAAEFVRLAENENINFAIANVTRFSQTHLELHEFLEKDQLEHLFLITAFCSADELIDRSWLSDPKLAGGGVLLRNCYEILDQIVSAFKVPQLVYALNTNIAADRQQRAYLTEDTAVVTMKFTDALACNIIASRHTRFQSQQHFLKLHTKEKTIKISDSQFTVIDSSGKIVCENQYTDNTLSRMTKLLESFALSLLSPDKNPLCSSAAVNLKTMAVIEAAYLSARTSMPEEPSRILGMVHVKPRDADVIR